MCACVFASPTYCIFHIFLCDIPGIRVVGNNNAIYYRFNESVKYKQKLYYKFKVPLNPIQAEFVLGKVVKYTKKLAL